MTVPQTRLLWWTALGLVPASLLVAIAPAATGVATIVFLGFLVVVLVDATRATDRLEGLSVEEPPVVRLSKNRPGTIELRVKNERQQPRRIRLALPWPAALACSEDELSVNLPGDSTWSRISWNCLPSRRGNYRMDSAFVEAPSPWGFWAVRRQMPMNLEIRVYPNLLRERNRLSALFLNRGFYGLHALRQVGKGREFEKLREYVPGDSFDDVHWKATARRARPVTKVYQIEKTQEIYVIIDASRLSTRPAERATAKPPPGGAGDQPENPVPETALERFVTAALVLGLAAERQGDLFGLLTFTDKIEAFVRAKNGAAHYQCCRDALYTLQPREVTPDFDEVAAFIRLRLRRRAMLFFLTALDDPILAESFTRNIGILCRQHLILVNLLKAPLAKPLFTDADVSNTDDLYRQLAGHLQWHKLRELEKGLGRRGVRLELVENEKLCVDLVSQYLNVKQRQLL